MTQDSSLQNRPARSALVVGAGIVGASIGFHLARAGIAVTIVDKTGPHAGASGRSWAWINAMAANDEAYFKLRHASVAAWRDLDQALAGRLEVDWSGCLIWDPHLIADDHVNQARRDWGANVRMLDGVAIRSVLPTLTPGIADQALLSLDDGFVDGAHATAVLLEAAQEHGAELRFGRDTEGLIQNDTGCVIGAQTDFGELSADVTIIASGTGCRTLLGTVGFELPVAPKPGLLVITEPVQPALLPMAIWGSQVHIKQLRDGRLVIGDCVEDPNALDNPEVLAQRMLSDAKEALPAIATVCIERTTVATRPMPADGLPVVGPVPDVEGLWLATMHSGFTLAAIVGKLMPEEVLGGHPSSLLESFRPGRFLQENSS